MRLNTNMFRLFREQHVSTDVGHLQVNNSYFQNILTNLMCSISMHYIIQKH
jgi:hypothetical protein